MSRAKRVFDASIALCALVVSSPLLLLSAIGIKLSSPGPIFYRAQRIARDRRRFSDPPVVVPERRQRGYRGREFTIYKLRTMRLNADSEEAPITTWKDPRVFRFGKWLRTMKIDELPQLLNVLRGNMALVGPRPEAPEIVRKHYTPEDLATLQVLPGLTSPGTLYYYTHCESMLSNDAAVEVYVHRLLPVKLALDRVYIKHATLPYDMRVILRTIAVIVARTLGSQRFPDPPELAEAGVSHVSEQPPRISPA